MASKISKFTAPNSDLFSGVFAVDPEQLKLVTTLEGALSRTPHALIPLGSKVWRSIKRDQSTDALNGIVTFGSKIAFVSFDPDEVDQAAALNKQLGISIDGIIEATHTLNNKSLVYEILSKRGFMGAVLHFSCKRDDLLACVENSGLKPNEILIKPSAGSGGAGIFHSKSANSSIDLVKEFFTEHDVNAVNDDLIVMEYMHDDNAGVQEICIDGAIIDGALVFLASHDKILSDLEPPFKDKIILSPGVNFLDQWSPLVLSWLTELGVNNTVFHIEARIREGVPIPIDFAARPSGGFISTMCAATSGVDVRLIHAYLMSGRIDLATEALKYRLPTYEASAIGAFYLQGKTDVNFVLLDTLSRLANADLDVLGYQICATTGESALLFNDASLSLCVGADDRSNALSKLTGFAHSGRFSSQAKFLS